MIPEYRRILATNSVPYRFSDSFSPLSNSPTNSEPNVPKGR